MSELRVSVVHVIINNDIFHITGSYDTSANRHPRIISDIEIEKTTHDSIKFSVSMDIHIKNKVFHLNKIIEDDNVGECYDKFYEIIREIRIIKYTNVIEYSVFLSEYGSVTFTKN